MAHEVGPREAEPTKAALAAAKAPAAPLAVAPPGVGTCLVSSAELSVAVEAPVPWKTERPTLFVDASDAVANATGGAISGPTVPTHPGTPTEERAP